jgi:hypothetical protein
VYFSIEVNLSNIFLLKFSGAPNKVTIWLDGAGPANNSIPHSFLGNAPTNRHGVPAPKNIFESIKILGKFAEITFL